MSIINITGKSYEVSGSFMILWETTDGCIFIEGVHGQVDGSVSYKTTSNAWVNLPVNELVGRILYLTDFAFDGGTFFLIAPCYPKAVEKKATNGYVVVLGSHKGKTRVTKHLKHFSITAVRMPKCIKIYGDHVVVDNYIKHNINAKKTIAAAKMLDFEVYETGDGYGRMTVIYCR